MESSRPAEVQPEPALTPSQARARFLLVLCGFTLAMLALSWPLWIAPSDFPRVPFVMGLPQPKGAGSWAVFVLLLGTVTAAGCGLAWRTMLALSVALVGWLVLGDQHRLQPWLYQYGLTALAFAACSERKALGL